MVIAEESRSQHENRERALRRLRQALYLKVRDSLPPEAVTIEALGRHADYRDARDGDGRLHLGRKDPRFWPAVGVVLDVVEALEGRVSDAASSLGLTTANMIAFLQVDPKVWEQVNILRRRFGQKPLHT
jgi:hypothetical protein